jgi:hypothetical protein
VSIKLLIQKNVSDAFLQLGDLVSTVIYSEKGVYNPVTDSHSAETTTSIRAVVVEYSQKELAATMAEAIDRKVIFDKATLPVPINIYGKLNIEGVDYDIKMASSDPAGATLEAWAKR